MRIAVLFVSALVAAAGPGGRCQQPTGKLSAGERPFAAAPASVAWPADRIFVETAGDGAVWAAGELWKARFDARGASFQPFLGGGTKGREATFALRSARCGEVALAIESGVAPVVDGQRLVFARGAATEFFELRPQGIEQQFRFAALPSRDELRLEVTVATDLTVTSGADGHAFVGEGGGVRYGAATAIDADGNQLALSTTWTGDALRITVPASFLANASLPLLVDPLIGTIVPTTVSSTLALGSTDIAYDHSLGQYYVTYERAFSATDHDVYVVALDSAMQQQALLTIDFTGTYWTRPRIATLEAHDIACVVAETSSGNVAPFRISRRLFTGGPALAMGPQYTWPQGASDRREPDVGGDASPGGPTRFLCAYEEQTIGVPFSSVSVRTFDAAGIELSANSLTTPIGYCRRVAVSKTCGVGNDLSRSWALVYRLQTAILSTTGQLLGDFVRPDGTQFPTGGVIVTASTPNLGSEWDVSSPTEQGTYGRRWLCVERRYDSATGKGTPHGVAFDLYGTVTGSTPLTDSSFDRAMPVADCDGCRYAVAWVTRFASGDADVRAGTFATVGYQLQQHEVVAVTTSLDVETAPALVAARGAGPNRYGLGWLRQTGAAWTVEAANYLGIGVGGITTRTTGCGGLAITTTGTPALGQTITIGLGVGSGIPLFIAGTPVSWPIGVCPGCVQGADGTTLIGDWLPINVPLNPSLVGAVLALQGARYDPASGSCLGVLRFSNTVDVTVQ